MNKSKYGLENHGLKECWVPNGSIVMAKNQLPQPTRDSQIVSNLSALFSGKQSDFKYKALRIMAACNLFGYGCSDEAAIMIMAGFSKALFREIGMRDITNEDIGKCLPSRATLSTAEKHLAADAVIKDAYEAMIDAARHFGGQIDHGH